MKRVITALLAALLVLSLAACGSGVETKKLAGTWTCTIDVTDRMNAAAEQALGLSAADGAAKMPLQLVLTVTEDGAYTLRYDSDAARTALDAYATALHPAAVESVYAAAEEQGLSREEYDAAMEKAGITLHTEPGDEQVLKEGTVDFVSFSYYSSRCITTDQEIRRTGRDGGLSELYPFRWDHDLDRRAGRAQQPADGTGAGAAPRAPDLDKTGGEQIKKSARRALFSFASCLKNPAPCGCRSP